MFARTRPGPSGVRQAPHPPSRCAGSGRLRALPRGAQRSDGSDSAQGRTARPERHGETLTGPAPCGENMERPGRSSQRCVSSGSFSDFGLQIPYIGRPSWRGGPLVDHVLRDHHTPPPGGAGTFTDPPALPPGHGVSSAPRQGRCPPRPWRPSRRPPRSQAR